MGIEGFDYVYPRRDSMSGFGCMFQVMYMHEALCCIRDRGRICHRSSRLLEDGLSCGRGGASQPAVSDQPNGGL